MKRLLSLMVCLCLLLCLLPGKALAADESRSYDFDLSINSAYEVISAEGQVLTVTLTLKRTDSADPAEMYGMQTELTYDDQFFQLVENSVMTASGVEWKDMARRTGGRVFYLNYVSLSGGEIWEPEVVVGSFQLKVIGTAGISQIIPENSLVSTKDGSGTFTAKDNPVKVILSTECVVTFEENGGSEVPDQVVLYGEKVARPEDPTREGYTLEGWYSDLDRTQRWNFDQDTVKGNMTLYANWTEGVPAADGESNFPWWILFLLLGVGILILILLLACRKKKVTFETCGGTELEPVYVKKNGTIEEPMVPVKPGAVFDGWFADRKYTKRWEFRNDKVERSITLYARWK